MGKDKDKRGLEIVRSPEGITITGDPKLAREMAKLLKEEIEKQSGGQVTPQIWELPKKITPSA